MLWDNSRLIWFEFHCVSPVQWSSLENRLLEIFVIPRSLKDLHSKLLFQTFSKLFHFHFYHLPISFLSFLRLAAILKFLHLCYYSILSSKSSHIIAFREIKSSCFACKCYYNRWLLVCPQLIFYLFSFSQYCNFYIPNVIKIVSIPLEIHMVVLSI